MRKRVSQDLVAAQCYFLGFRTSAENIEKYHHALILADDHESFVYGINETRSTIRAQRAGSCVQAIDLVYVRSLALMEPAMKNAFERHVIEADAKVTPASRNGYPFRVFGLLGDCETHLMTVTALDALTALRIARWKSSKHLCKNLKPLDVRYAHPVTLEFDVLFTIVASRFIALTSALNDDGYAH